MEGKGTNVASKRVALVGKRRCREPAWLLLYDDEAVPQVGCRQL